MEVSGMQIPEGPAVGANNNNAYGANGMLVPERAGLVSEVSRGSRDGPSVGEKILPSSESRVEGKSGGNKSHCCDHTSNKKSHLSATTVQEKDALTTPSFAHGTSGEDGSSAKFFESKSSKLGKDPENVTEMRGSVNFNVQHASHVCILAESTPTWLAVADGWSADVIEIFSAEPQEATWFVEGLRLGEKVKMLPTVVGVRGGAWRTGKSPVVLIQGSAKFCQKMVASLVSIGATPSSKIIIASSQKIRNLALPFRFERMKHDKLGGVSNAECHVGFAKSITLARQKTRVSDTPRVLLGNLKVTTDGAYIAPPDDDHSNFEEDVKSPFEYHSQLDLFMDTFAAPCVHSLSHWVKRELTGEEFLTSMDIPAVAVKHAKNLGVIANGTYGNGLLASPPLKILQEAGDMFFGTRDLRVSSAPSETSTDYILQSEIPGFEDIYQEINQSRAARNDDAGIDFDIWNE